MRDKRPRWAFELKVELLTLRLKKARPAQLARPNNLLGGGEARAAKWSEMARGQFFGQHSNTTA
jgi:hypothetical protein